MAAYVIVDEEITDPARFDEYRRLAAPSIAKFNAKFLVRGGTLIPLAGGWIPRRLVVLEFESMEQARNWYDSPEYGEARQARDVAASVKMVIADGV